MTDDEFYAFCLENTELRIERKPNGKITIMPPTTSETGRRNSKIHIEIGIWNKMTRLGETFDSTWERGATPFQLTDVGNAPVIPGWNKGLIGAREGGRRQLIIPPADGYGDAGAGGTIKGGETLIFVIDIVRVDD